MTMKYLTLTAFLVGVLCSGCSTTHSASKPSPATLRVYGERSGAFDWNQLRLVTIDKETPSMVWSDSSPRKIDAGPHRLALYYKGNRQLFGYKMRTYPIVVFVQLESGKEYELRGEFRDTDVTVFVVDAKSGELVSERVSAPIIYD